MDQRVTTALLICVLACSSRAADDSLAQVVATLQRSVPFSDTEVIPAGESYVQMAASVSRALSSARLSKHLAEHESKWNKRGAKVSRTGSSFDCSVERSHKKPTSVHKLRPADIDVIAAIGDSLTAGMGIYSRTILTIFTQYRGHSFTMGGKEDVSVHTTLPTILKRFNPKLVGFSTGISGPDGIYAGFNEAVVGNRAEDMPRQATQVVQKMKQSDSMDFENDWKLINLFIGGNDVCDQCKDKERFSPDNYEKHIRTALDYLYENVPRAFVNLVELMDVSVVVDLKDQSVLCKALLQTFWCKCGSTLPKEEVHDYSVELQRRVRRIAEDPKWTTKDDFTVVLQPFLRNIKPPLLENGQPDLSYFAPDCFHLSDKGQALGGLSLWNNMLEPVDQKSTNWILDDGIHCPTEQSPYLATKLNS